MSRKSIILCMSALAVVLVLIGVAVGVLYSGTDDKDDNDIEDFPAVLSAVPSDAMLISYGKAGRVCPLNDDLVDDLSRCDAVVSLHYSGKMHSLYVLNLRKADDGLVDELDAYVLSQGMKASRSGDLYVFSSSDNILKSAMRHAEEGVSVKDAPGFAEAFESVKGPQVLFIPGVHAKRLLSSAFTSKVYRHSAFLSKVADWYAFEINDEAHVSLGGKVVYDGEPDELITSFENCIPGISQVADYLPSYTLFAVTLPVENHSAFRRDFQVFADSRNNLKGMLSKQADLKSKVGIAPMELFDRLGVKELATAGMIIRSRLERVNLIRVETRDVQLLFCDSSVKTLRGYMPKTHEWKYKSFVSSVYGSMFAIEDESCFTYIDGWLVVGSRAAIDEYVTKDALGYTLKEHASFAGHKDLLSAAPALAVAYFSLSAQRDRLKDYLGKGLVDGLKRHIGEPEYSPAVLYFGKDKDHKTVSFDVHALSLSRTKAPSVSRDTTVIVPEGPFKVLNSYTGKTNTFYQNRHKSLCLRDENGKDQWGVPFDKTICGTAHNIDLHDNGNLQIIFGAGSGLYVIDRTGRYAKGFPLDLKKEICLGPDLYQMSGQKCVMVLHKDNSLELYTLPKGKKPSFWHTIDLGEETIKSLPERLTAADKDYWIVRTAIQTLIYPSSGGKPVTKFKDDAMIRTDSEVVLQDDGEAVEVSCYDGRKRIVKLK